MVIMYGRLEYDIHRERAHDSANSTAADDVGVLTPPEDASGCLLSVEGVPVRLTFDGENPTPSYGILLRPGEHFLPFAREIRFVSAHEQRQATVSLLWVRVKRGGHGPAE
jgi:hypothetical protein